MARIKRGVAAHRRHKKVLDLTKGHRASTHKLYRRAHESLVHAMDYAYNHRRERKGDMRRLWIARVNAAARLEGLKYGQLIHLLREAGITVDRKMMADLAVKDAKVFSQFVAAVKPASGK